MVDQANGIQASIILQNDMSILLSTHLTLSKDPNGAVCSSVIMHGGQA